MEVDISKPLPSRVWIGCGKDKESGFWQKLVFESNIDYCPKCQLQGHNLDNCRRLSSLHLKSAHTPHLSTSKSPVETHKASDASRVPKAAVPPTDSKKKAWQPKTKNKGKAAASVEDLIDLSSSPSGGADQIDLQVHTKGEVIILLWIII